MTDTNLRADCDTKQAWTFFLDWDVSYCAGGIPLHRFHPCSIGADVTEIRQLICADKTDHLCQDNKMQMRNNAMKNIGMMLFIIVLFITLTGCNILDTHEDNNIDDPHLDSSSSIIILFIGSSYFAYNRLPDIVNNLSDQNSKSVDIHSAITSGLYLADHANLASTESKINEKEWDYVILQGVGSLMAYPEYYTHHPVYPALITLQNKILANCNTTRIVYCLPWAYEDGMTWLSGWTDDYAAMQKKIFDNTIAYSDALGLIISPVGWAWNTVLQEKNYPLHYLHMSDWNHPSLKGSYLMACVIYSTIFQESTTGTDYYANISENEAVYFQEVASSTVLDSLELWNIK